MAKDIRVCRVMDELVQEVTLQNDLKTLQEAVGGYIETIRIKGKLTVLCDEDAGLKGIKPSATIITDKGPVMIRGVFIICNMGSNFCSLSDNDFEIIKNIVKLY